VGAGNKDVVKAFLWWRPGGHGHLGLSSIQAGNPLKL
jgi:hypothetical protein